jgi:hypothetical protein
MPLDPFAGSRNFKVVVSFHPVGSAPRLKVSKFTVDGNLKMAELTNYLSKIIKESDVHLYVSNSIEPMEDQYIGDFVKIFGKMNSEDTQGSINIHYSVGRAYL